MRNTTSATAVSDIDQQEKLALLDRIAASQPFRRASRLRDFLLYVGRHSVQDDRATIHEQEIGTTVFGRPPGYDTGIDNIVRVNATELRKRLEMYFSGEGANEPLVVSIPRGSYVAIFEPRQVTVEPTPIPDAAEIASVPPPAETGTVIPVAPHSQFRSAPWILSLISLMACLLLLWQNSQLRSELTPWKDKPALRAIWGRFFTTGQPADVVLADTSFALAQDMLGRNIDLGNYIRYEYKHLPDDPSLSPDRRTDLGYVLERNNGSIGDFIAAQHVLSLDPTGADFRLTFAREYTPEAIKVNSVVLIGSAVSNPWVRLYADRLNFAMEYDIPAHRSVVRNRHPNPGEAAVYTPPPAGETSQGLAVLAFLPDLNRTGSAILIEGTDSQATRAAGEFITSEDSMASFRERLGNPIQFPYFEVLLRNTQITSTPLRAEVVAYRTY